MLRDSKNCKLLHKKKHLKRERKEIPFKEIKKLVFDRDGWRCRYCGAEEKLIVHHLTYKHLGNEINHLDDLVTLCEDCHKRIEKGEL